MKVNLKISANFNLACISIPIKEQCVFVCLSAFYRPHEISYFAALPPSPRAGGVAGGPARAGKHVHAQREHARACRTTYFSTKKS